MWVVIRKYVHPDLTDEPQTVVEPVCVVQLQNGQAFNPASVLRTIANRLGIDRRELHAQWCDVVTF